MGKEISILIGGAVAPGCVVSRMAHCKVLRESAKTICLGTPAGAVWLPRWALIPEGSYYRLSHRYEFTPEQWKRLESAQWVSGFSA
ncbi:hypothetical protein Mesil_0553 [Allomeiothermus silvanus DSM 9946]|uniref:Uncharacterized protein n=1 Tax=Allomeiothermus silvanus (strain ATCC 700542 / DSM 9946 / NBRC 106475 / NCIMB 13440 / VI-R2) TaxID=526227 RepID=D7BA48_ALLS1|nr:hypothetical protein [Allomeiothermus silvanus]ADH62482.1 hypothetical protein Mesil_0553 [Allomeiothermus silvanus DSM 9946]